jgi:uncharacterized coiled-coil DUF342 family protein
LLGCGKKVDENKSADEVRAEAEDMNAEQLRALAMKCRESIIAKQAEIKKLVTRLSNIPPAEMTGTEAKQVRAELEVLNGALRNLNEQYMLYYRKIVEKGGDTSGLKI